MFYFLLFAVTTILFYLAQICEKRWSGGYYLLSFLGVFLLAFVAGCRDNSIGTDIHVYGLKTFNVARGTDSFWEGYEAISYCSEPIYYSIVYVAQLLSSKFGFALFLQSFILFSFVSSGIRNIAGKKYFAVGMLVFNLYYYSMSFNLMRQCVAIAFLMWSYRYFQDRKPYALLLCAVLGFFFHKSSSVAYLTLFVAYWLTGLETSNQKKILKICALGSVAFVLLFGALLSMVTSTIPILRKYDAYGENSLFGSTLSKLDILLRLGMLVVTVLMLHLKKCDEKKGLLLVFFLILDVSFQFLGIYAYYTTRISYYVFALDVPLFINLFSQSRMTKGTRTLGLTCMVAYISTYCINEYFIKGVNETYPYQSDFLGIHW